jgi:NAD(P)H-dependent flavin oxidoreductase YrpB (nitropropane dioxygenase family)
MRCADSVIRGDDIPWLTIGISSRFTDLVGCDLPIQLAAMGKVGSTELAAAVAKAGGFGMVRADHFESAGGACGTNFLMPLAPSLDRITEYARKSRVIELFYGDPSSEIVDVIHGAGALAGWQVGSVAEAVAAQECGCDYVVAQGIEAGTEHLTELLPATLDAVQVPVVAAGGVATAERFVELMQLGADAVRVGTRFVVCTESMAHPQYVDALVAARGEEDTVVTEWFGEGWEHAPHRVLRSALEAAQQSGWRKVPPPDRSVKRDISDMALYAGAGVGHVNIVEPAAAVIADLVRLL